MKLAAFLAALSLLAPAAASPQTAKVGEAYAHDGFTVKAIAMYKKLTKIAPPNSMEHSISEFERGLRALAAEGRPRRRRRSEQ